MKNLLIGLVLLYTQSTYAAEYIVKFKNNFNVNSFNVLEQTYGQPQSFIPQLNMAMVSGNSSQLNSLAQDFGGNIEYVQPNYKRHVIAKGDGYPNEGALWGMKAINALPAWQITKGSKDVILAISDTGTWMPHSDLNKNIWVNSGETGLDANGKDKAKNKIDDDGNGYVDDVNGYNFETDIGSPMENHYHGTHVAGTVGAVGNNGGIAGVNWITSIMTVKFIGMDGEGSDEAAIKSILYAADNGAKAINASWGGSDGGQALYDAIDYAGKKGVLFVAAAGNDGQNADKHPMYPAAYELDNIISVAATTDMKGHLASFSNYGFKSVDIAAPGENINSTFTPLKQTFMCGSSSHNWYCTLSGTSMAAPHVTGVVGLIYAANPNLTAKQVKDIIMETAAPSQYLVGKVVSQGQLDAGAAVKKAKEMAGPN